MIEEKDKAQRFNQGKRKWSYVHFKAFEPMIEVLEFGALKYAPNNWRKGLDKLETLESIQRHVGELIDKVNTGEEEIDAESLKPIIGHIMCGCMFYSSLFTINKNK